MYAYYVDTAKNRCAKKKSEVSVVNKNIMFSTSSSSRSILQGSVPIQPHSQVEDYHHIVVTTLTYAPEVPSDLFAFLQLQVRRYLCGKAFEGLAQHTRDMNVLVCAQEEEAGCSAHIHLLLRCSFAPALERPRGQDNSEVVMTSVGGLLCSFGYHKGRCTVAEPGDGLEMMQRRMHHTASTQMDTAGGQQVNGKSFLPM